jgi:GDPmannose 4,6-dehydratase
MKTAIVTGITGQDGSYLAEYLLERDYYVYGLIRRHAVDNGLGNLSGIINNKRLTLIHCDMTSASNVNQVTTMIQPREFYNLAAQSDVRISFDMPEHTYQVNASGVLNVLETIRHMKNHIDFRAPKFYQASTSEMFGRVRENIQDEHTPFYPRSPYGVSKLAAYWMTVNYREAYNMFNCNGILFNHESPRRGKNFVTRKIVNSMKRIKDGNLSHMQLGNLDAMRDWGHAKDYVEAMYLMMQKDYPDDYVIATGEQHSVREFVELSGQYFGFDVAWEGEGLNEIGYDKNRNKPLVTINPEFYRPTEVQTLLGNSNKARDILDWKPKYNFEQLVEDMCRHETGE